MAEVINRLGGVNLRGGAQAAEIRPTTGTEGRSQVPSTALNVAQGITRLVNEAGQVVAAGAESQRKAKTAAAATQAALEQQSIDFGVALGLPGEEVAKIATASEQLSGEPMPSNVRDGLIALASDQQRLGSILSQLPPGDRARMRDIATRAATIRFLADHPGYGLEAMVASGRLSVGDMAVHFEDDKRQKEREEAEVNDRRKLLTAAGVPFSPSSTPDEIDQLYNTKLRPEIEAYQTTKRQVELDTQRATGDAVKLAAVQKGAMDRLVPWTSQGINVVIRSVLSSADTPDAKAATLDAAWDRVLADYSELGINPTQLTERLGLVRQRLDLAKEAVFDINKQKALQIQVDMLDNAGRARVHETLGADFVVFERYLKAIAPVVGDAAVGPKVMSSQLWQDVETRFSSILAATAANPGVVTPQPAYPPIPAATSPAAVREVEQKVATTSGSLIENWSKLDADGKAVAKNHFVNMVQDPRGATSSTAWGDVLQVMDSPNFLQFANESGAKEAVTQQAAINTRRYVGTAMATLTDILQRAKVQPQWGYDEASGELTLDAASLQALGKDRDAVVRATKQLSRAGRVMHKVFGVGESPLDALQAP